MTLKTPLIRIRAALRADLSPDLFASRTVIWKNHAGSMRENPQC